MTRDNAFRSLLFWSWNEELDAKEICRQIKGFAEQGVDGFFIHSRSGRKIPYMGEEWMAACEVAIQEAAAQGLEVWLYDEDGWPSGFAGGNVPALGQAYQYKILYFTEKPSTQEDAVIAVYRRKGEGYIRIPVNEGRTGDLYAMRHILPQYVDLLYPDTTAAFINFTHEQYRKRFGQHFGKTIKGIFFDEPQLHVGGLVWSVGLEEEYRKRYGGELLDHLWMLCVGGLEYAAFRHDYWKMIAELFAERFTKPLEAWCKKNRLELTGHFSSEDGLCDQVTACGDVMINYRHMSLPGIDHLGRRLASPVLMKQVESVARQQNRPAVLCEIYGCSGWDIGFADLVWIAGWQASMGINVWCLHLASYSLLGRRKRDYPAFFSYQEPWWEEFRKLTAYLNRLSCFCGMGEDVSDCLVLSPMTGIWASYRNGYSNEMRQISNQYRLLLENLQSNHVRFHIGDELLIAEQAGVRDGIFSIGACHYKTVIIPFSYSYEETTVEKLLEFIRQGGRVYFVNERPVLVSGRLSEVWKRPEWEEALVIQNRCDLWAKVNRASPFHDDVSITGRDIRSRVMRRDGYYRIFLLNYQTDAQNFVRIRLNGYYSIQCEDACGCFKNIPVHMENGKTYLQMWLKPKQAVMLTATKPAAASARVKEKSIQVLGVVWERSEPNALTLDYFYWKPEKGQWSSYQPIVRATDAIYAAAARADAQEMCVQTVYEFYTEGLGHRPMELAAESVGINRIWLNGTEITGRSAGWWIDRCIRLYEVGDLVAEGRNEIRAQYTIPKMAAIPNLSRQFENERNRFCYPVEPESFYLRGDFDVRVEAEMEKHADLYLVKGSGSRRFTLCPAAGPNSGDITCNGGWFYRGGAKTQLKVPFADGRQVFLRLDSPSCSCVRISVNGNYAGLLMAEPFEMDLTEWLSQKENTVELELLGSNRNLFGPHHHVAGNPPFVGPHTFAGQRGYEDFVSPEIRQEETWTDQYAFIPYHAGKIWLDYYIGT